LLEPIFWFAVVPIVITFGLGAILGAPFLPIRYLDQQTLLDLAGLREGSTIIDLGSGDGRLLRAAAQRKIKAIGYEINPLLYAWSWLACWRYRRYVRIYLADFWRVKLPKADAIYVFLIDHYMEKLDKKLVREIKTETLLISYVFEMPKRRTIRQTANIKVYRYP
jgi:hypothetical protein